MESLIFKHLVNSHGWVGLMRVNKVTVSFNWDEEQVTFGRLAVFVTEYFKSATNYGSKMHLISFSKLLSVL